MSAVDPQRASRKPPPNRGPFASEDEALQEVVKRLVTGIDPEQIWLFGSRAENRNAPDSDFDLLVVTKVADGETALDYDVLYAPIQGLGVGAMWCRAARTSSRPSGTIRQVSAGKSCARGRCSMSAPKRIAAFFTLADSCVVSATALLRADQFEDAALYVQQAAAKLTKSAVPTGRSVLSATRRCGLVA